MVADPWLFVFLVAGLLVVLGTTSGLIDARLYVSEPLACVLAGIALGPAMLGLVRLDPLAGAADAAVLREAARVTLAIAVVAAAMRLPKGWIRKEWRGLLVAVGPGMLLMTAAGAAVAAFALGLPPLVAALVGAAVAPTDPVLSAPILTGTLARRAVPAGLRHGLTAESGLNDGLALPLVAVPVLLLHGASGSATLSALAWVLAWQVGAAVLGGALVGWLASCCLRWAARRPDANHASLVTVALALAVATLAGGQLLHVDGILAAFVAGVVLNEVVPPSEAQERQEHFNEALGRFFDLPVLILFGAAIPWGAWLGLGWGGAAFAAGILLLRRPPAWLLLAPLMPWTRTVAAAGFAGWFGPVGTAAVFYALDARDQTGLDSLWPVISLAVGASVLAHGVTGTPFTHLFGRATSPAFRRAARTPGQDPLAVEEDG